MAAHKHKYLLLVSRHLGFLASARITHDEELISYIVYRLRYKYFRFVSRYFGLLISARVTQYGNPLSGMYQLQNTCL